VLGVNSEWRFSDGGKLVLESNLDSEADKEIFPRSGQAIIFETISQWHEVKPVSADANQFRKTLALFAWDLQYDHAAKSHADFSGGMTSAQ
jgi:Rps23 Pro-64 3,4-dihydroxylase Tpa1-like proline 4-hydroxylase